MLTWALNRLRALRGVRWRYLLPALGLLLVAAGYGSYLAGRHPEAAAIQVINPHGTHAGGVIPEVAPGRSFYTDTFALCSTTGAPVPITGVGPVGATGPVVIDWAVHHGPFADGRDSGIGQPTELRGFAHQPVTGKCSSSSLQTGELSMIAFSIRASNGGPVGVRGFRVDFPGGSATVPFFLETCPGKHCPHYPGIG